jgi:hypothetical protein
MLSFKEIIDRGVRNWKDEMADKTADNAQCFRGSNTPLLVDGKFVCDSSSHCPRIALLRRLGLPTDYPKTFKDLASHMYGRAMEELVKKLIIFADVEGLQTVEEEDFKVQVQDDCGSLIYSARPDLILCWNGIPTEACEFKSVQSDSTGEQVFNQKEPKLGACIQNASQMHFHDLDKGTICYIEGHWISGYSFKTKKPFKLEPGFTTFDCEFNEQGDFLINGKKTVVNRHNIEGAITLLNEFYTNGEFPEDRPKPMKTFGGAGYSPCEYCALGAMKTKVCDRAESILRGLEFQNFTDLIRESFAI